MAKGQDPFEKFRNATLSGAPSIKDAISSEAKPVKESKPSEPAVKEVKPSPAPKESKPVKNKVESGKQEQVSFFIDKDLKKAVGLLKYELDVQLKDLYEEAIVDLLKKYHKL